MADSYITDPDLLKQLDTPEDAYVSDPELLKQLNGGDDLAVTEGTRRSYANELAQSLQKSNLFTSATSAAEGAWDKDIRRTESGEWDLPLMAPIKPAEGILGSVVSTIGGATTALGQKLGARMDLAGPGVDKQAVQSAFNDFQKANNLSDEEVQTAWKDFGNINRTWQDDEKLRVLSNGTIFPNQNASEWLDPEKAETIISKAPTSDEAKQAMRDKLPDIRNAIASNKLEAYEAASDVVNKATAAQSLQTLGLTRAVAGKFTPPSEWAKQQGRTDTGTPEFVRDYENAVVNDAPWVRQKLWGLAGKGVSGWGQVANTVLGLGGIAGSETAAKLAGEGAEAQQTINQGLPDTGIAGAVVEQVPSILTQLVTGRLIGAAGSSATTTLGTFGMAGAQSAGMTYADLISQGVDPQTARDKAVKTGVSTAVITSLFGTGGAGGVESAIAGKEIGEVTMKELVDIARQQGVKDFATSPQFRSFVGTVLKEAGGEAAEEGIDQFTQAFLTADPDTSVADAWSQAKDAAMVGGALGGGVQLAMKAMPNAPEAARAAMQPVSEVPVTQAETRREGETEPATAPSATQPTPQTNENTQLEMPVPAVQAAEQRATGEGAAPVPEAGLSPMEGSAGLTPPVEEGVVKIIGPRKSGSIVPQFVTPEGATVEVLEDGKVSFMVPPEARGQGVGNAAVERVKNYADATGTTITLDIEPLGNEPGMNRAELADWYERRGFTVSEDRLSAIYEPSKESLAPELMTPDAWVAAGNRKGTQWGSVLHKAVQEKKPINAALHDQVMSGKPKGYVRDGDILRPIDLTRSPQNMVMEELTRAAEASYENNSVQAKVEAHVGPIFDPTGTTLERLFRENYAELRRDTEKARDLLRSKFGDTVTVYRAENPKAEKTADRNIFSWTIDKETAEKHMEKGRVLREEVVPVDLIEWYGNWREHEVLIDNRKMPKPLKMVRAKDFQDTGIYEVQTSEGLRRVFRDPDSGAWLDADRRPAGYPASPFPYQFLGYNKKEALAKLQPTQTTNEQNTEGQPGQETAPETAQTQAPVEGGAQGVEAGGEGAVKWTKHQGETYPDFLDNIKNGRYDPETAIDWLFRYGGLRNRKDAEKYYEALTHSKRGNPPATLSPTEYVDSQFVPASIYNRGGYPEDVAKDDHRYMVEDALESQETVSAEAVDSYGIKLPEGYVRQGDLYIYQPTQTNAPIQRNQQQGDLGERPQIDEGGTPEGASGGNRAVEGGEEAAYSVQALADAFNLTEEQAVVADAIGKALGARVDVIAKGGVPGGGALSQASDADTARFNELTKSIPANPTQADLDAWKAANPEAYAELKAMRERVLREAGYGDPKIFGNAETNRKEESRKTDLLRQRNIAEGNVEMAKKSIEARPEGKMSEIAKKSLARNAAKVTQLNAQLDADSPVVLYHGRSTPWTVYERRGTRSIWAVSNPNVAATYGDDVAELVMRLNNPMVFDANGATFRDLEFEGERLDADDLSRIAEERGHDGLVIRNFHDSNTDDGGRIIADHFTSFDPTQIKSTEPLNLDESGKLIPPSQWGDTGSPSILYQFAGEKANIPPFMRDSLDTAKAMAAAGKSSEEIRAVTGWFPGKYDGKMRWEIPDAGASLKPDFGKATKVSELLDHPALFEAYPAIADTPVVFKGFTAGITKDGKTFVLPSMTAKFGADNQALLKGVLHETQHLVQQIEGFARGGTPDMVYDEARTKINEKKAVLESARDSAKAAWGSNPTDANLAAWKASVDAVWDVMGEKPAKLPSEDEMAYYRRIAGEIESRDVEARAKLTPEQLKATAPYSSENIAPEAAIVLFQGPKASFEIAETGKILLRGLQNPDFSSAVHEIAHAARRSMDQVLDEKEVRTVEQWAGVKNGKWGRYNEEKWARAWERYFREGKAPLARLQGIFDKIAGWMTQVYQNIVGSDIDVEITPEIRAIFDKLAGRMGVPESARPNQAADLEWWLGALGKVEGLNRKERAHTRLVVEGKETKGTHAYATINRPPSQIALGRGRAYDEQGLLVTDYPLSIDEQMSLQVVPVDSETTTATANQLFAKGFELENNGKTYLVTPSTTSNSLRVTELDAEGPTGHIHLDNRWFVSDLRKYLLGAKVFDERAPDATPPAPEFGDTPVDPDTPRTLADTIDELSEETIESTKNDNGFGAMTNDEFREEWKRQLQESGALEPPTPELPNFDAEPDPNSPTGLYHAQSDEDRARLGLPPRFKQPRSTDQDAWDRATAAEDAHRAAGKPGTAGTDLLTNLLNDVPRVLTKDEHALLLHEKLVREQAVNAAQAKLNDLPANAPEGVRKDAQAGVKAAQDAFDLLLTYADAAGSRAGLSLQARKMLVYQDYTLAAVVNRLKAAKNMNSDKPAEWTEKDQAAAVDIANKLQQAQERVEALEAENSEQVALIEQLTRDVERAQTKLENRLRTSKARAAIKAKLDPKIEEAKARIEARRKANRGVVNMAMMPTPDMLADLKDYAIIYSAQFVKGAVTLNAFSEQVIREVGDWIAPHVENLFRMARAHYIETAESVTGDEAPTPDTVVGSIDPNQPLDKVDVWRLARAHVVAGLRGRNVLDAVFNDLVKLYPNLTREAVSEEFTGYGKVTYPSTKEVPKELRRIRALEREYSKQLDIAAGQMPKRTGYQGDAKKDTNWAEVRAEQQKTADALRELENQLREAGLPVPSDDKKLANALNTKKRRITNEIEEIELALKSKTPRTPKTRTPIADDAEVAELEKRLAEKRKEYADVFDQTTAREKRILASLKRRTAELERRMRERDFTAKPKLEPVNTEAKRKADFEFEKVKSKYDEMRHQYLLKNAPFSRKVGHYTLSTANLLKLLTLGFDVGVVMRQLGTSYQALSRDMGMLAPTKEGAKKRADGSYLKKILMEGVRAFGSAEYEHAAYEALRNRPNAGWDKTAGLVLNAPFDVHRNTKEDIPPANLLDNLPWWMWPALMTGKVVLGGVSLPASSVLLALSAVQKPLMQGLDRAQRAMTNQSRALFFDEAMNALHENKATVQDAKAIAKAVMVGTGRGTAPQFVESAIPFLNQLLLATRYYISRFQALSLYPIWNKDARQAPVARKEIQKMYARSVTGRATLLALAAMAFGKSLSGDDEDPQEGLIVNPTNPNFGRVRLADGVNLDFMSGLNNFASIAARYAMKLRTDPETGKKEALGAGYTQNLNDEVMRFVSGKRNVLFSFLTNYHAGAFFGGKPATVRNALEEATTAIIINDTMNVYKAMIDEYGPVKGSARASLFMSLMLMGAGTSVQDSEAEKEALRIARREATWARKLREARLNE